MSLGSTHPDPAPIRPHWLRRFGGWCLDKIQGHQAATLRAIERRTPVVYWLIQTRQASVAADRDGHVRALQMSFQPIIDAELAFLADLPLLEVLRIQYCPRVTNDALKHLTGTTHLQIVDLDGTQVSGFGLRYLKGHQNLQALSLENTWAGTRTMDDLNALTADDPENRDIVQTYGFSYLKSFPRLKELYLSSNFIGDGSMAGVAQAKSLETLFVFRSRVTDQGLQPLYGHPHLTFAHLMGPQITSEGLEQLRRHLSPQCEVDVAMLPLLGELKLT